VKVTRSVFLGCGSYLPGKILTNYDLAKMVDTSDDWIFERTGIKLRHIARDEETTSDLAVEAARRALRKADIGINDIDVIIVATTTPDETFPSTATRVQARLNMLGGAAFDIQAVCSGFIYAVTVADSMIRSEQTKTVLVIGAETMSRLLDWTDRATCVLFGDGAGAVVMQAREGEGSNRDRGVLVSRIFSDGRLHDLLYVDGGVSTTGTAGQLRMQGREVFKHAVNNIAAAIEATAREAGVQLSEIDWFVPHQANQRILDGTARKLGIRSERVISTVAEHGNTSAASVPLALSVAVDDGRIRRGNLVLMEAMGGGFTWGATLLRW
jgi:3-oxoacyl-[acyl-carrier-protein] synthase-3